MISCMTDFFEEINHHSSLPLRQQADESRACLFWWFLFVLICWNILPYSFPPSLSRYKLKFSPDKVDTMIVQAICECFSILSHDLWFHKRQALMIMTLCQDPEIDEGV